MEMSSVTSTPKNSKQKYKIDLKNEIKWIILLSRAHEINPFYIHKHFYIMSSGKKNALVAEDQEIDKRASIEEYEELKFAGEISGKLMSNIQNRMQLALDM